MSDPFEALVGLRAPSLTEATKSAQALLTLATGYEINSEEEYLLAIEELKNVKSRVKGLEEMRLTVAAPLNAALTAFNDIFRVPSQILIKVEGLLKNCVIGYTVQREQVAKAARQAEQAAQQQAAQVASQAIAEAQASGSQDQVQAAQEAAFEAQVSAAVAAPAELAPIKVEGVSKVKQTVKARVVDLPKFLAHVIESPGLIEMISVDEKRLNALAKAIGMSMDFPGIEVYIERSISVRT